MALDTGWRKVTARLITGEEAVGVLCEQCQKISVKLRNSFLKNPLPTCDYCDSLLMLSSDEEKWMEKFQK